MPTDRNPVTWTSAQVLTDVRRKASLPVTSTDWSDAVLLREATDVAWSFAGWALAQAGEGRMLASLDRAVTLALSGAYGKREYLIPPLAAAGTVEMVTWTNAEGRAQFQLARIDPSEESLWTEPLGEGSPGSYALMGDRIRLYPLPNSGGTLRITYQRRHPELVTDVVANAASVVSAASASTTTSTITVSANITGIAVGDVVDIIRSSHPYAPIVASAEVTVVPNATSITVDAPIAMFTGETLAGARVVRAGQSPYVHLPLEMRAAFTEKTTANILRVIGDIAGMQAAEQAAATELTRVIQMLSPRSKRDKPKAVNPYSHLRMRLSRGR